MCETVFEKRKICGGTVKQLQLAERFFEKGVTMRNFAKLTRKHLCQNPVFDKVKLCRSATSLKRRL